MEQRLILDRYRPLEELAAGGFGTVLLAWDTRMQRRVAIKRLWLPVDTAGVPQRPPGLGEARTAAMLNHPSIVTVFDFDTDTDEAFLVMEHVDGVSLADLLEQLAGPLTLDETAAVIEAVSAALRFAHDNGVLHLDIKPDNVLVDREGRVKVTDFGMAEVSSLAGHNAAWGGTPGYMPLEQLEGARVSERTDEWALAVLAFECLTGVNPFAEMDFEAGVADLEVFDAPLASRYNRDVPADVDDVLATGLGARPADRYPSVAELAADLLPLLGDPGAGRELLAELVDEYAAEPESFDEPLERVGMWDRLRGPTGTALLRAAAAVEAAWLAWAGLRAWELQAAPLAGAVALVVLVAAFAPSLAIGLGMAAFASGFAATGSWGIAVVLGLAVVAWWWWVARHSPSAAVLPLSGPVLGMSGLSPAMPLLAGFVLPPARAAATALAGGAFTMLASAASARTAPYLTVWPPYALDVWGAQLSGEGVASLLRSPAALVALLAWPAAAAVMGWACGRATRAAALVGTFAGAAILAGGYLLADEVARFRGSLMGWGGSGAALALGASLILVVLVVALGAPIRPEEDLP